MCASSMSPTYLVILYAVAESSGKGVRRKKIVMLHEVAVSRLSPLALLFSMGAGVIFINLEI